MPSFWKPEACGQTVLPDRSSLKGQTLVENAKIQKFKCDILSNFQTMCFRDPPKCQQDLELLSKPIQQDGLCFSGKSEKDLNCTFCYFLFLSHLSWR